MNLQGHKQLLGLWISQNEGAKFWLTCLTDLNNRGLRDIFVACVDAFAKAWDPKYPTIAKMWRAKWADIVTQFDYPESIRKAIYTTNAIESVNSVIRKFTRNRKIYPNQDSVLKIVYMAIHEASKKWTMPICHWKQALNHFAIMFEGRLPTLDSK